MGQRGEAWVVIQAILLLLYATVPQAGLAWSNSAVAEAIGWSLALAGGALFVLSIFNLGRSLTPLPRPLPDGKLVTGGAYALVRHPIYSAVILVAAGFAVLTEHGLRLVLSALLFLFFDLKARTEERWLQEKYPKYAA